MTNESAAYRAASAAGRLFVGILVVLVLLGIGYSFWPKIKQAYYDGGAITTNAQPTQPPPAQPDAGKAELERLRAQNAAMQAQLNAARSNIVVPTVKEG